MKTDSKSRMVVAIAVLTMLVGGNVAAGQQSDEAAVALQRAIRVELVDGDLTTAIGMYEEIISRYAAERAVVAQALLRLGDSHAKLGDDRASAAYGRVLSDYGDQADAVAEARSRLASLQSGDEASRSSGIVTRQVWPTASGMGNAVSPDGRYVAHVRYPDLAVYDTETGRSRLLTEVPTWVDDGYVTGMAWSQDGTRIAYSQWIDNFALEELHLIRADGSDDHILVANDERPGVTPMAWSRDGDFIVCRFFGWDDASRIGTVSTADGTVQILKTLGPHSPWPLSLSPDDKYIVYDYPQADDVDVHDVFILATDGSSEERLVSHVANDERPFWTPDGGRVVFLSDRSGRRGLYAVEVRDGRPAGDAELVRHDVGPIVTQGVSRSGALYYTLNVDFTDVHVAELELNLNAGAGTLSEPTPLTERFEGTNKLPSWSPDGRRVAFVSRRGEDQGTYVVVKSMDTGEEQDFAVPGGGGPSEWSADGRHLLIGGRGRLDLETGEVSSEAFVRDIVSEGRSRYFATAVQEEALRAAGIRILPRAQARALLAGRDLPLRPGEELMWMTVNGGVRKMLPDGEVQEIGPRGHIHSWALSPDGTQVAWAVSSDTILLSNRLLIMPVKGGEIRELTQLPRPPEVGDQAPEIVAMQWTPDGQTLLYQVAPVADQEEELWQVAVEGGAPARLDLPLEAMGVRFHPDGRRVALWTRTRAVEIWLMEGFPWQHSGR